ncbi:MAG: carboxypeptidase [Actinobacteria bacterium]|nr:carboxypeptidase [Actinomycetota bacterium]
MTASKSRPYAFDRFLRYDELTEWLHGTAAAHPGLMSVASYGRSHDGRELWLATITDASTGPHDSKPAHWVDANIHAIEVTGGVAALYLIHHLVTGFGSNADVTEAVRTRTFYVAPRVNPDGVEWALADSPQYLRSSIRPWPWADAHQAPGLHERDINGDGRILTMRIPDPTGNWTVLPDEPRLMARVPATGVAAGVARYRLLYEGDIIEHDGFTIPLPPSPHSLDLNRNFPSGWGTNVTGSGDHPLSEPEIDSLVRAIVARRNICGYNAYHTSGGVLLRPSGTVSDSALPPVDVWAFKHLGATGTSLTGYTVHSVFDDFTFDKNETMSGSADDWVYDHLGVYGWTTEFWDVIQHATGKKPSTHIWYTGPTGEEELAVYRWAMTNCPEAYADWVPFDHPQLGAVEIGGWDDVFLWGNAPKSLLLAEVRPHAEFAVYQALCSPKLEVLHTRVVHLDGDTHRVEVGIANTGWLPTDISVRARKERLVLPLTAELSGAKVVSGGGHGNARQELGQLSGRLGLNFNYAKNDGTPERVLAAWVVSAKRGATVTVEVSHQRAGRCSVTLTL